jgi:hypothetical protein
MNGREEANSIETDEDSTMGKGCTMIKAQLVAEEMAEQ